MSSVKAYQVAVEGGAFFLVQRRNGYKLIDRRGEATSFTLDEAKAHACNVDGQVWGPGRGPGGMYSLVQFWGQS